MSGGGVLGLLVLVAAAQAGAANGAAGGDYYQSGTGDPDCKTVYITSRGRSMRRIACRDESGKWVMTDPQEDDDPPAVRAPAPRPVRREAAARPVVHAGAPTRPAATGKTASLPGKAKGADPLKQAVMAAHPMSEADYQRFNILVNSDFNADDENSVRRYFTAFVPLEYPDLPPSMWKQEVEDLTSMTMKDPHQRATMRQLFQTSHFARMMTMLDHLKTIPPRSRN